MRRRLVVSVVLAALVVVPQGAARAGTLAPGTIAVEQDGIEWLFRNHVSQALATTSDTGSALLAGDDTAGMLVALRTASGFATLSVPAFAVAGVVGGVGGALAYLAATQLCDPDKGVSHPVDVPMRFTNDGSPYGAIDLRMSANIDATVWVQAKNDAEGTSIDPAPYTGQQNSNSALFKTVGILVHSGTVTWAGGTTGHIETGGTGIYGPWDDGSSHPVALDGSPWTSLTGDGYNTWCGGGCYPNQGWSCYASTVTQSFTPKPLSGPGLAPLSNMDDADARRKARAAVDPYVPFYPGQGAQVTPPADNSNSAPPVLYMKPDNTWGLSPHGLPVGDNGVANTSGPTFDPNTGDTTTASPAPSPTPTATASPSSSPSVSPSASPSASASPGGSSPPPPPPTTTAADFASWFWDTFKGKFPFDFILDLESTTWGAETHLHYTAFAGKTFTDINGNTVNLERDYDLDWTKPIWRDFIAVASIGVVIWAIFA